MPTSPFSISPLPHALYLSGPIRAATHKAMYTIEHRQGLCLVLGDYGHGKTSLLRRLDGALAATDGIRRAFITDPETSSPYAFLRGIADAFDLPHKRSLVLQKDAFKEFVLRSAADGFNVVLLLDEAQGLTNEMFELLRGFLNYETNTAKLIQIILAGQIELREKLKQPRNRAIKSRIIMSTLLDSLTFQEMERMLRYRCELADIAFPFTPEAMTAIYALTSGAPRDVLALCARAYELAQLLGDETVTANTISSAAQQEEATYAEVRGSALS